jgi:CRP/FNR family transcriptional regulator, anaerobic regulatory protein
MKHTRFALAPPTQMSVEEPLSPYRLKDGARIHPGAAICRAGDPALRFFRVTSGVARSFVSLPDGRRQVTDFHFAGDLFGLQPGMQRGAGYTVTVEAITDVTVSIFSLTTPSGMPMPVTPGATRMFLDSVSDRLADARQRLLLLGRKTAAERLATFLLQVSKRVGSQDGAWIELPMTRGDIADYLGLTLETVSRMFRLLREKRIILVPSLGEVRVLDRGALESLANGEAGVTRARCH